jgi:hypothetical protein
MIELVARVGAALRRKQQVDLATHAGIIEEVAVSSHHQASDCSARPASRILVNEFDISACL